MVTPEAIQLIQDTAVEAAGLSVIRVEGEPERVYHLYNRKTGELKDRLAEPKPRRHKCYTVEGFCEAVDKFGGPDTVVFCGQGQVVALPAEADEPEQRLTLTLPQSEEYMTLTAHRRNRACMSQKDFVRLLRVDLAGCVTEADVNAFRNVRFTSKKAGTGEVRHGRDAVASSIEREIVGGGDKLPETIDVRVFVYGDWAVDASLMTVTCAVEIDIDDAGFVLIPLAGQLELAQRATDAALRLALIDRLAEEITIICGSPGAP